MKSDSDILDVVYNAALMPEAWPQTMMVIAGRVGAAGGNLIRQSDAGVDFVPTDSVADSVREFLEQGWGQQNTRVSRMVARAAHPGFLTDSHLHSKEELVNLPMYRDFLTPRGEAAGAGTLVQGAMNDALIFALEAFPSHEASRAAVPWLDTLRPDLARAMMLSAQIHREKLRASAQTLNALGLAAAFLDRKGKPLAMNHLFEGHLGVLLQDRQDRLRAVEGTSDRGLREALHQMRTATKGFSLPLRNADREGLTVLHLIPLRREARDIFFAATAIAVLADPQNRRLPQAGLIQALFDVSPAEARVARSIARGKSPNLIAVESNLSVETVRTYLKQVYYKTGTSRQSELAALLGGIWLADGTGSA